VSFVAELKQRKLVQWLLAYAAGAWLLLQVIGLLGAPFGWPDTVLRGATIAALVGFFVAALLAWYHGERGAQRVSGTELVLLSLLPLIGGGLLWRFAPAGPKTAVPTATLAPLKPTVNDASAKPAADIVRGIAVLPFDNMSPDPDNAFFAGGVYEEVLTRLSRIGQLRVISRTSMERIAEEKLEVRAIGARLGVSHVLEGSVRRAGDQIRVTVQLIEADSDAHVWAENYDRKLDDVFAIQTEIALAIADQLKLTLSPALQANLRERSTQNPAAYALYLRALEEIRRWSGEAGYQSIIDLLEPAVAADAGFLEARVLLAEAYGRMVWVDADPEGHNALRARQAVAQILERWPDHPRSRIAQGQLLYNLERNFAGALAHFEAARAELPNDYALLTSVSFSLKRLGRNEAFLDVARRVVQLDPESTAASSELALALLVNQRLDEAVTVAERVLARHSDDQVRSVLAQARLARDGDIEAVLQLTPDSREAMLANFVRGDFDALQRPRDPRDANSHVLLRAELLHVAGRQAAALAVLEPYTQQVVPDMFAQLAGTSLRDRDRSFRHGSIARWAALVDRSEQAREHLSQALAAPPSDDVALFYSLLSTVERRLGNADAAWRLVEPYIGQFGSFSPGELRAFKPFYDEVYGDSPSYHAYMSKIAGEQP
jgi:TolB-like protein